MIAFRIKINASLTSSMTVQMWGGKKNKTRDQCSPPYTDLKLTWLKIQKQHIFTSSRFNLEGIVKLTLLL